MEQSDKTIQRANLLANTSITLGAMSLLMAIYLVSTFSFTTGGNLFDNFPPLNCFGGLPLCIISIITGFIAVKTTEVRSKARLGLGLGILGSILIFSLIVLQFIGLFGD